MSIFWPNADVRRIETVARRVYDVTGAGDTVISTLAVMLAAGLDFEESCKMANAAAGKVVERVGTSPITSRDISEFVLK